MNGENESLEPTTYDTGLTDLRASVPSMNLALEWEDIALRADGDASAIMKEVERGLVQAANRVLKARLNDVDALFGDEPIDIERWTAWCYALETELIKVLRHVVAGLPNQRKPAALDAHGLRFQENKLIQQDNEFYPWDRVLAEVERLRSEGDMLKVEQPVRLDLYQITGKVIKWNEKKRPHLASLLYHRTRRPEGFESYRACIQAYEPHIVFGGWKNMLASVQKVSIRGSKLSEREAEHIASQIAELRRMPRY